MIIIFSYYIYIYIVICYLYLCLLSCFNSFTCASIEQSCTHMHTKYINIHVCAIHTLLHAVRVHMQYALYSVFVNTNWGL
jgi:hypothetical protein